MKTEITLKAITLKTAKGARENIISAKGGFFNQSLTQCLHKYPRSISPMVPSMWGNRGMVPEKVLGKQPMLMEASTMDNG